MLINKEAFTIVALCRSVLLILTVRTKIINNSQELFFLFFKVEVFPLLLYQSFIIKQIKKEIFLLSSSMIKRKQFLFYFYVTTIYKYLLVILKTIFFLELIVPSIRQDRFHSPLDYNDLTNPFHLFVGSHVSGIAVNRTKQNVPVPVPCTLYPHACCIEELFNYSQPAITSVRI